MKTANINSLIKVLNDLPEPIEANQRMRIQPPERIISVIPVKEGEPQKKLETPVLTLIAIPYCEGSYRWLEWELEL